MTERQGNIGGVTVTYQIMGNLVVYRTFGGGTKRQTYTYHLDEHTWLGKAPHYQFAEQLLALSGHTRPLAGEELIPAARTR